MSQPDFQRVRDVFHQVCSLEGPARAARLDELCEGDQALRAEVLELLAEDGAAPDDAPLPGANVARELLRENDIALPDQIGRYKVRRLLGTGGMGIVYEAEQDRPQRTVALKVMRPGVISPALLRRFEREAEVLGRLQHPGIAQIYDAGSIPLAGSVQPYFAMELVAGVPLDTYVAERSLGVRDCLTLFAKVCDAVEHAHHRGVIHRDLKPANILVDADGQPKVLDFGIARATNSDLQVTTVQTEVGQLIGTLAYMSPEQVAGKSDEIDARSDVYALGVVLFELLGAKLPYDVYDRTLPEAIRVIRDAEPTRLSAIDTRLRGDVETIVGKAIAKDRNIRYPSVAAFAADIRRYLTDQPIVARPPSAMYQLRKFAHRNRAATFAALGIFAALIAATVVSSISAYQANQARDQAQQQAEIAEAINRFLNDDLLAAVEPSGSAARGRGRDVKMIDVLGVAAERIETASQAGGAFDGKPQVESAIRLTLGRTLIRLGQPQEAEPHLQRAYELRRTLHGLGHLDTLSAVINLGGSLFTQGRLDDADALFSEALPPAKAALGEDHPRVLIAEVSHSNVFWRREDYESSLGLLLRVYEARQRTLGPEHEDTIGTLQNLSLTYKRLQRYDDAEQAERTLVAYYTETRGVDDPLTLRVSHNLGTTMYYKGDYAAAERAWRSTYEQRKRVLGPDHRETLSSCINLASSLFEQDRPEEAEPYYRAGYEAASQRYGEEYSYSLSCLFGLANVLREQEKYDEAEPLYRDTIRIYESSIGRTRSETVKVYIGLFDLLMAMDRKAEAEQALTRPVQALLEEDKLALNQRSVEPLIDCRLQLEMVAEARALAQAYYEDVVAAYGSESERAQRVADLIDTMPAANTPEGGDRP